MKNNLKAYSNCIKLSIFSLIIFLVTLSIYSNTLVNEFTDDELVLIRKNADVYQLTDDKRSKLQVVVGLFTDNGAKSGPTALDIDQAGGNSAELTKFKSPLSTVSWIFDQSFSQMTGAPKDDAELFHLSNVLLHAMVGVQVFLFTIHLTTSLRSSGSSEGRNSFGNDLACFVGTLLFVLHPINSQIVANVGTGRSILLSANFVLLSLLTYRHSMIASMLCFVAGSTAGGLSYSLMLLLPLYHYVLYANLWSFIVVIMLLITLIQYTFTGFYFSPLSYYIDTSNAYSSPVYNELKYVDNPAAFDASRLTRVLTIGYSHAHYMWLLVVPKSLSTDWSYNCLPIVETLLDSVNIQTVLTYCAIALPLLFTNKKKQSVVIFFYILFGVITMLPKLNISFYSETLVTETNLYLPSIAFCILLGRLLSSPFLLIEYKQQQQQQAAKEKLEQDNNESNSNTNSKQDNDDKESESIVRRRNKLQKELQEKEKEKSMSRSQKNKKKTSKSNTLKLSIFNKLLIAISLAGIISITVIYSISTYQRNALWKDKVDVLFDSLNTCPSAKLNDEIAGLYIRTEDWENAKSHCEQALDILPTYCHANYKFGIVILHTDGNYIEASKYFANSISHRCAETQHMTWMTVDELYTNLMKQAPESFTDLRVQFAELVLPIDPELSAKHYYDAAMIEFETNNNLVKSQNYIEQSLDIILTSHRQILTPQSQWCQVIEYIGTTFEPPKQSKLEEQLNKALSLCTQRATTKTNSNKKPNK